MTSLGKLSLRLGIYGVVFTYLICDLQFCNGPLSRRIKSARPDSPESIAAAKAKGVVARVYGHTIDLSQVQRAVVERLWLEGKTLDDLAPANRKLIRYAALEDLIDHELLRMKVSVNTSDLRVSENEINDRYQLFSKRFPTKEALTAAMESQGIPDEQALRDRLAARIQQEKYVEWKVGPLVPVTDDEARKWFEENQQQLANPERVQARHIFLPTLGRNSDEVRQSLTTALAYLTDKSKDFATLARELSEDPASKDRGGDLGWMTRARLPADLATPLFSMPLNEPRLVRSRIGWHIIEVTARKAAEPRTFEQAKPDVIAAIEAVKRRQAATDYRDSLRKFEAKNIEIFHDMLGG